MITWVWLWVFLLLPLPWVVQRLVKPVERNAESSLRIPFYQDVMSIDCGQTAVKQGSRSFRNFWLGMLVWLLLLTAAARPQWIGDPVSLPVSGRDVMMAVDVSGSMEIPDFTLQGEQANRLMVVKAVAGEFIKRRKGDRVGLILFGSQAYVQTPLTFDRTTAQTMLNEAEIGLAGKETAIGDAIGLVTKRLKNQAQENRVLILLTDGANTAGDISPLQATKLAAKEGIRIYTIGVGADQMQVSSLFGSRTVNPSQDLDEGTLKEIAQLTGGTYLRAKDKQQLEQVYRQLDELEPAAEETEFFRPTDELYPWPLGAALVLSVLFALTFLRMPSLLTRKSYDPVARTLSSTEVG
ncbi:MAG: VWA domain-containing protein [Nitrospirales bacterium]|nr:VWA domain-containing protein [Nitrospira sp.]MDR4500858.1 VWA domain-containing protein [Nitrospirales bacterium]